MDTDQSRRATIVHNKVGGKIHTGAGKGSHGEEIDAPGLRPPERDTEEEERLQPTVGAQGPHETAAKLVGRREEAARGRLAPNRRTHRPSASGQYPHGSRASGPHPGAPPTARAQESCTHVQQKNEAEEEEEAAEEGGRPPR